MTDYSVVKFVRRYPRIFAIDFHFVQVDFTDLDMDYPNFSGDNSCLGYPMQNPMGFRIREVTCYSASQIPNLW